MIINIKLYTMIPTPWLLGIAIVIIILLLYWYRQPVDKVGQLNELIHYSNITPNRVRNRIIDEYIHNIQDHVTDNFLMDRVIDIEQERAEERINRAMLGGQDHMVDNIIRRTNRLTDIVNVNRQQLAVEGKKDVVKWRSDSQNVHDSNITKQIKQQYHRMKASNDAEQIPVDLSQLLMYLYQQVNNKVLNQICKSNHNNIPERLYLYEVWRRSMSKRNTGKEKMIQQNIKQALNECEEKNGVVCVRGRVARVMGSLALVDPDFGIFKSKQITRNEFMEKCGYLINKHVEAQDKDLQKAYINDEETQGVLRLKRELEQKIIDVAKDYVSMDHKELESYIEMAKQEI